MDPSLFINGIPIGIVAACPIGAVAVLCIQRTINKGFLSGLVLGFGSAFGDFVFAVIAGFSITFIADFLVANRFWLGLIGGLFMLFLGYKIFKSNPLKQILEERANPGRKTYFGDFLTGLGLTISNPLTVIVFGGLFAASGAVSKHTNYLNTTIMLTGVITGALIWWLFLVSIINLFRKKIRLRNLFVINKIMGICICCFGLSVIILVTFFIEKLE